MSAGSRHSLALTDAGGIFAFGNNELGQLGVGDNADRQAPAALPHFGDGLPLFVVAAGDHSIAICHKAFDALAPAGEAGSLTVQKLSRAP